MSIVQWARYLLMVACFATFAAFGTMALAEEKTVPQDSTQYKQMPVLAAQEMPVLTGNVWQRMTEDGKTAFVWGIGHVVTIEKHVEQRHPELKRPDFTAKLSEGLTGVPMETIVKTVDDYYNNNPQNLDMPVMRVIWRQLVKPKLTTGIADKPIDRETQK